MGPSISRARAEVNNELRASIENRMTSLIDNNSTSYCQNQQTAENLNGCNVKFEEQVCKALAVSNLNATAELRSDMQQDIFNDIAASATAMNDGGLVLQAAQVSDSSTLVNNLVDMSAISTQALTTKCTRNATGINQQTIRDCTDSVVNFGKQDVDVKIMGDCTVNHVAESKIVQKLVNVIDASATSKNSGLSLASLFLVLLFGFLAVVVTKGALKGSKPAAADEAPGEKNKRYALYFFIALFFILVIGVWPGVLAWHISAWPYKFSEEYLKENDLCAGGAYFKSSEVLSPLLWYDPFCLSSLWQSPSSTQACTEENKWKHYKKCGLFADGVDGCNSTALSDDRKRLQKMFEACAKIPTPPAACTVRDITYLDTVMKVSYDGCKRCTNDNSIYGLFVHNDKSCDSAQINPLYYKIPDGVKCPNDPYCVETWEELQSKSPNDCRTDEYQTAKQTFSQYYSACNDINTYAIERPTADYTPRFKDQCPPDPYKYLKCDKDTGNCFYHPNECTDCDEHGNCRNCPGVTPAAYAACHNDFSTCCGTVDTPDPANLGQTTKVFGCRDPSYQKDIAVVMKGNEMCAEKEKAKRIAYYFPFIVGGILVLLLLAIMYLVLTAGSSGLGHMMIQQLKQHSTKMFNATAVAVVGVLLILGATYPFGLLAIVNAGEVPYTVYGKDIQSTINDYKESKFKLYAYIMLGVGGLMFGVGAPYAFYLWKTRPDATTTLSVAAALDTGATPVVRRVAAVRHVPVVAHAPPPPPVIVPHA
jgi:hypothetical protein